MADCGHSVCEGCVKTDTPADPTSSPEDQTCPLCRDSVLQRAIAGYKARLRQRFERVDHGGTQTALSAIYTELLVTEAEAEAVASETLAHQHEVWRLESSYRLQRSSSSRSQDQAELNGTTGKEPIRNSGTRPEPISCNNVFKPCGGGRGYVKTVMTRGVAGVGKTTSVQRFVLDWADGLANQDVDFIFVFSFGTLNAIRHSWNNLHGLLLRLHPELKELQGEQLYEECRVVLVFDGLDESQLDLNFQDNYVLCDTNNFASVDVLVTNLIQGNLLPSAQVWVTSRPSAANQIPARYVDRVTEIHGFTDQQREEYFRKRLGEDGGRGVRNTLDVAAGHTHRDLDTHTLVKTMVSQIKSCRSLRIMCQMPSLCCIAATLFPHMLAKDEQGNNAKLVQDKAGYNTKLAQVETGSSTRKLALNGTANSSNLPQTLTEMFIHFLLRQLHLEMEMFHGGDSHASLDVEASPDTGTSRKESWDSRTSTHVSLDKEAERDGSSDGGTDRKSPWDPMPERTAASEDVEAERTTSLDAGVSIKASSYAEKSRNTSQDMEASTYTPLDAEVGGKASLHSGIDRKASLDLAERAPSRDTTMKGNATSETGTKRKASRDLDTTSTKASCDEEVERGESLDVVAARDAPSDAGTWTNVMWDLDAESDASLDAGEKRDALSDAGTGRKASSDAGTSRKASSDSGTRRDVSSALGTERGASSNLEAERDASLERGDAGRSGDVSSALGMDRDESWDLEVEGAVSLDLEAERSFSCDLGNNRNASCYMKAERSSSCDFGKNRKPSWNLEADRASSCDLEKNRNASGYMEAERSSSCDRNASWDLEAERAASQELKREVLLRLAELAFTQLGKGGVAGGIGKDALEDCGICVGDATVYSVIFREIFQEETQQPQVDHSRLFRFSHPSVQDFLAAYFAVHCAVTWNAEPLEEFLREHYAAKNQQELELGIKNRKNRVLSSIKTIFEIPPLELQRQTQQRSEQDEASEGMIWDLMRGVVERGVEDAHGSLDLFLRFLVGLSLETNQNLLLCKEGVAMAPVPESSSEVGLLPGPSSEFGSWTQLPGLSSEAAVSGLLPEASQELGKVVVEHIRTLLDTDLAPDRCVSLVRCLEEVPDDPLHRELQKHLDHNHRLDRGGKRSQQQQQQQQLPQPWPHHPHRSSRRPGQEKQHVPPAVCSALAHWLLVGGVGEEVQRDEEAQEKAQEEVLDVRRWPTSEKGHRRLLPALRSCRKAILTGCELDESSVGLLCSVLPVLCCPIRELDLSGCPLHDPWVSSLSTQLKSATCRLEVLRLSSCSLSDTAGAFLSSVLSCPSSCLRELDLSHNLLGDRVAMLLSAQLESKACTLHTLRVSCCGFSDEGCLPLACGVGTAGCILRELDIRGNTLSNIAIQILLNRIQEPHGTLHTLRLDNAVDLWRRLGAMRYACPLSLDPNTAHCHLLLSPDGSGVTHSPQPQDCPPHPDRFQHRPQVLSSLPLPGPRCYWEAEWRRHNGGVAVGVAYGSIGRKGWSQDCLLGYNDQSWCLFYSHDRCSAWHGRGQTIISHSLVPLTQPPPPTISAPASTVQRPPQPPPEPRPEPEPKPSPSRRRSFKPSLRVPSTAQPTRSPDPSQGKRQQQALMPHRHARLRTAAQTQIQPHINGHQNQQHQARVTTQQQHPGGPSLNGHQSQVQLQGQGGALRVGVYVDSEAGCLAFYSVHWDSVVRLHTFHAEFSEPLYAAARVREPHATLALNPSMPSSGREEYSTVE